VCTKNPARTSAGVLRESLFRMNFRTLGLRPRQRGLSCPYCRTRLPGPLLMLIARYNDFLQSARPGISHGAKGLNRIVAIRANASTPQSISQISPGT
jgi:hypothetical protein